MIEQPDASYESLSNEISARSLYISFELWRGVTAYLADSKCIHLSGI